MKKYLFILILTISCAIIFIQCRKNNGKLLDTYTFSINDLKIIPYNGGETIILTDSLGDTIKYSVNSSHAKDFETYYKPDDPNLDPDHVSLVDYFKTEINQTSAIGDFNIQLKFSSPFHQPVRKVFKIGMGVNENSELKINSFSGLCIFNNDSLIQNNGLINVMDFNSNLQVIRFDTLKILNKYFYSVYSLTQSYIGPDTVDCIKTIYYTINEGIIGIKTKYNIVWCLNN